jgi:NADH-quinone oxidoreductase subunit H
VREWGRGLAGALGAPEWIGHVLLMVVAAVAVFVILALAALLFVWLERKVAGRIQSRYGPNRAGKFGLLQTVADAVKLLMKEDIIAAAIDKPFFILAPYIVFVATFAAFVVIPWSGRLFVSDLNVGVLYLIAMGSFVVVGILMAGWASNNKWSLLGSMRSVAQIISYEIPVAIALLSVIVMAGTLNLREIQSAQSGWFWKWFLFQSPFTFLAFFVYFVGSLAEANRTPFDLPEAEQELTAGFMTEYSGMRWAFFFLAEYGNMLLVSLIAAMLFLGGWNVGIPGVPLPGPVVLIVKAVLVVLVQIWIRWTLPRLRVDQLMSVCWKYLLPISFLTLIGAGAWRLLFPPGV